MTALGPDEVRTLLRECVTVVAPGETLVVRTTDLNPNQIREHQEALDRWHEEGGLPFRAIVVHGDGFAVQAAPTPGEVADIIMSGAISINKGRALLGLAPFDAPSFSDAVPAPSAAPHDGREPGRAAHADAISGALSSLGLPPLPAPSDQSAPAPSFDAAFAAFAPPGTDLGALMSSLKAARMPPIPMSCPSCRARGIARAHAPGSAECVAAQAELDQWEKSAPGEVTWCHACARSHPRALVCPDQRELAARLHDGEPDA